MRKSLQILFTAAAAVALTATFGVQSASAGECPAGKSGVNLVSPGPDKPSNVTDNIISSIDLGQGYNIPGRMLRLRKLVIQPGGIVPWHSHKERPANIYVVSGAVTEYTSSCAVPLEHKAGDVVAESGDTSHWWRNNTKQAAVLLSSDILPPQGAPAEAM